MGYKSDEYHDPILNDEIAIALGAAKDKKELDEIRKITLRVNDILKKFLAAKGIILVDFKLEFGRDSKGSLLLADEISPDTCRFWDAKTKEIMDKDRFRKDMGSVLEFYEEVRGRVVE
jgi:phosphoribosylaminoimidazole-succinocarboxamide synthase